WLRATGSVAWSTGRGGRSHALTRWFRRSKPASSSWRGPSRVAPLSHRPPPGKRRWG
ncbi:MAG: hypothetical protein AVDCRST_MAG10-2756, partial [uncultured Acidimicrobiales bacterium]